MSGISGISGSNANLLPLLLQAETGSSDSLSQFLALENQNQGSGDVLSSLLSSQNNNQNLLGFLYDSGQ